MGYIGLPNALAQWIASLGLSQVGLILVLLVFFIIMGCFLDGISLVVLTMGVLLPTVQAAGIDLIWFGILLGWRKLRHLWVLTSLSSWV